MKDKFEEIIERECFVYLGQGKEKSIKHAAERCNTLHQQAMKDILNKISNSPRNIDLQFTLKEIAKENNIEL